MKLWPSHLGSSLEECVRPCPLRFKIKPSTDIIESYFCPWGSFGPYGLCIFYAKRKCHVLPLRKEKGGIGTLSFRLVPLPPNNLPHLLRVFSILHSHYYQLFSWFNNIILKSILLTKAEEFIENQNINHLLLKASGTHVHLKIINVGKIIYSRLLIRLWKVPVLILTYLIISEVDHSAIWSFSLQSFWV